MDNHLKFMKDILILIGKNIQSEYINEQIHLKCNKGIPRLLIDRINNYDPTQIYIVYHSILSKNKSTVEKICQAKHVCPKTYNEELARALDKLQDYFFNNL